MRMLKVSLLVALTIGVLTSCNNDPEGPVEPRGKTQYVSPGKFVNVKSLYFRNKTYYYTDDPDKLSEEMPEGTYFDNDTVGVGGPVYILALASKGLYSYPNSEYTDKLLRMYSAYHKLVTVDVTRENVIDARNNIFLWKLIIRARFKVRSLVSVPLTVSDASIKIRHDQGALDLNVPGFIGEQVRPNTITDLDMKHVITLNVNKTREYDLVLYYSNYLKRVPDNFNNGCKLKLTFKDAQGNSFEETFNISPELSTITNESK